MIHFESLYFQKINFTQGQLNQYAKSAARDLKIAQESDVPDVVFKFSYDALIKIGITLIAKPGYN